MSEVGGLSILADASVELLTSSNMRAVHTLSNLTQRREVAKIELQKICVFAPLRDSFFGCGFADSGIGRS
jgi:hypothetical protein